MDLPVVKDNCAGHMVAEVLSMTEVETHYIILARVKRCSCLALTLPL
jgi:flavin reductase (DIM6/NTAB) family NADH-FMN oxidoreductase RutF